VSCGAPQAREQVRWICESSERPERERRAAAASANIEAGCPLSRAWQFGERI